MDVRRGARRVGRLVLQSLAVWAVLGFIAWLDRRPLVPTQQAAVWGVIVGVIELIGTFVGDAAAAIAVTLEGVVLWLVSAFGWLLSVVGSFLSSTGAVFAKVWEGMRVVWSDVLKPALVWIDQQFTRLQAWLKDTFAPVFKFLNRVREELQAVYKRFVQPIVDTIEFLRQLNRVLLAFHIHFLQGLDRTLQAIEQRIEEPILWINAKLNEIWNALDLIVTADGLFQRLTLIKSMSRYAPAWMNGFWNAQIDKSKKSGDDYSRTRIYPLDAPWANGRALAESYRGVPSRTDSYVAVLVPIWRQAAGVDPPGPEDS